MSYIDAQRLKHVRAAVKLVAPKDWRYKVTAEHGGVAVITIYATPHPLGEFFAPHKA